jgi:hypothetical protein
MKTMLGRPSSAFLEHSQYQAGTPYHGVRGVTRLKKIMPVLLLAVLAITLGALVSVHAVTTPKTVQTGQHSDKDDLQTGDKDESSVGDKDDGNVQTGTQDDLKVDDHDDGNVTVGHQETVELQEGLNSNVETGACGNVNAADTAQQATTIRAKCS